MQTLLVASLALLGLAPLPERADDTTHTRRVSISYEFSGHDLFLHGGLPAGSDSAFSVMQGPGKGAVRLMEKGRVVLFWMGVRQYSLAHAPGLYLVNLHCPSCNGIGVCKHAPDLEALNEALGASSEPVGPAAIRARAELQTMDGEVASPEELEKVTEGYWELQQGLGLYGVKQNAIRITADGTLYHTFSLPTQAPEGKYQITTNFLKNGTLVAVARNDLFVRQSGLINWLSRLAERHALTYGAFTVAIALAAGFLAGTIFKRDAKH
jgi:hypothetical protein